jgi:hypothetical protein
MNKKSRLKQDDEWTALSTPLPRKEQEKLQQEKYLEIGTGIIHVRERKKQIAYCILIKRFKVPKIFEPNLFFSCDSNNYQVSA